MITRGMVLDKASEKLIIQATDDQIEQFAVGDRVKVKPATHPNPSDVGLRYHAGPFTMTHQQTVGSVPSTKADVIAALAADQFVYDKYGRCLGRVTRWTIDHQLHSMQTAAGLPQHFAGPDKISIEAEWP